MLEAIKDAGGLLLHCSRNLEFCGVDNDDNEGLGGRGLFPARSLVASSLKVGEGNSWAGPRTILVAESGGRRNGLTFRSHRNSHTLSGFTCGPSFYREGHS